MPLPDLSLLDTYRALGLQPGADPNMRSLEAPLDQIGPALRLLMSSVAHSLVLVMFQYSDPDLDGIIKAKLQSDHCYVQLTLDKTEAGTKTEAGLLTEWQHDGIGNSIAIGSSEHGAFIHKKLAVIDGLDVVTGSTNWTASAEDKQDNHLIVLRNAALAAELTSRANILHDLVLKQMAAKAKAAP